ncbi:M56 family metallopeptidase, partial [Edaphobacter sp. HDX4]|uniref:M56 family metallopeptidase n=1 Tax=Edaphobacter sp. HDX4 TaxID=2794064 RepID=UPI002FE54E8A
MSALELWLVSYLANSVWMVPFIFTAAWATAAMTRSLGPRMAHRIWVAALMLEILLPALRLRTLNAGSLWRILRGLHVTTAGEGRTAITMSTATEYLKSGIVLPHGVVSAIAMIYAAILAYFTAKLVWSLWRTLLLAKNPAPIDGGIQIRWRAVTAAFGINAGIAESREAYGPSTVGLRNGLLLLPDGFAERTAEEDLTAVMAHECAHIVRRDFAKNLLYSLIALPCAFHPAMWLTQARLSESREMVCDAIAAEMLGDPKKYARSLLRLVSGMVERVPRNVHAIGIFDANHLERRIMILTGKKGTSAGALRAVTFAACAAICLGTCASALTLRTEIGTEANGTTENGRPMAKDA